MWLALLQAGEAIPLRYTPDVREVLRSMKRGSVLEGMQLLEIADAMEAVTALGRFLGGVSLETARDDAGLLPDFSAVSRRVRDVIDPSGGVRSDASEALQKAVFEERSRAAELRERAEELLGDPRYEPLLRDRYVTQREGRFVLPIRTDRYSSIPGIVHDASGTGATLFFEPEDLHKANNRLVEARAIIREEMARLLAELTSAVMQVTEDLRAAIGVLGRIDVEVARARLAQDWNAVAPLTGKHIEIRGARQPLLLLRGLKGIVSVDLILESGKGLILSGPNAGGKTAALKTLGICVLLMRAGCYVPAESAMLPDDWDIGVELGDPQNLGEDLSTFSGHLARLGTLAEQAGPKTLILIDELLKGTDPADGAPLARAYLEDLMDRRATAWVTTHYGSVKAMPVYDDRFVAARTAYESGRPAYEIIYGEPGPSYAFETAERIGISKAVLDRARGYRKGEAGRAERALTEVDELRKALAEERKQAETAAQDQRKLRDRLEAELSMLQRDREKLVKQSAAVTLSKLEAARDAAERAERIVLRRKEEGRVKRIELGKARQDIERAMAEVEHPGRVEPEALVPGAIVYSRRLKQNGEVVRAAGKGKIILQVGKMQVTVPVDELAPAKEESKAPEKSAITRPAYRPVAPSIDVRGNRLDEARGAIEMWLDGALLARQSGTLRIIHGVGTGALRDGIRSFLREHAGEVSWEPGDPSGDGDGVTLIHLE